MIVLNYFCCIWERIFKRRTFAFFGTLIHIFIRVYISIHKSFTYKCGDRLDRDQFEADVFGKINFDFQSIH